MPDTDDNGTLVWIESGRRFSFEDIVFWRGKGQRSFEQAARTIDTIVLGPHATAAFPAELQPFVSPSLTRRKQFDYSDVCTSALGRAWAQADDRVVFVENPHPRLVSDANRTPPTSIEQQLREFYRRLRSVKEGDRADFTGIDAVRPLTFAGEPVLPEPADEESFQRLVSALNACVSNGVGSYVAIREQVVDAVCALRFAGDPLTVISLHDTSNLKAQADGAIRVGRPASEQMPWCVNFGNRGDRLGRPVGDEPVTFATEMLHEFAAAWAKAFSDANGESDIVTLNKPYKGAYETVHFGNKLRALNESCVGAVQAEFNRRLLIGSGMQELLRPGVSWPVVDQSAINGLVVRIIVATTTWRDAIQRTRR